MVKTAAAILDAIVASACRRTGLRTVSAVLDGINPKSFYRARETGWLGRSDLEHLLNKCEDDQRDLLRVRWLDFQQHRIKTKLLGRLRIPDVLRARESPDYWLRLARAVVSPITDEPWMRPHSISNVLDQLDEKRRQDVSQEQALRNALILVRAALAHSVADRAETRLTLLSVIVAALKIAGVLGHCRAHRWIRIVLADLHKAYPGDDQIRRVLLAARAIELSHAATRTGGDLRQAIKFHAEEAALAGQHLRDSSLAQNWPVIYREARGAIWNLMNLRLDAGYGEALEGRFFRQHLEWRAIVEDYMPLGYRLADNPSLAVETAAYDVRFRASVLLDRPNRIQSWRGCDPEAAICEVDGVLNSSALQSSINLLTRGHLLGLRAESLLCRYADSPRPNSKDEYIKSRDAAVAAYQTAGDEANWHFWAVRLKRLECSIGL